MSAMGPICARMPRHLEIIDPDGDVLGSLQPEAKAR